MRRRELPRSPIPPTPKFKHGFGCSKGVKLTARPSGRRFDTNDALYDLAWSEINENQLITACGDGSIKLFDLGVDQFPVMNFHEHKRETFSVCWNSITKDSFISSSWDGTVKIVRPP